MLNPLYQDRDVAFDNVSKLYLQYVKVYRTLNSCYDLMVHPQKRQLLRKLLDSTIGRIIELKVTMLFHFGNFMTRNQLFGKILSN